ncbi:ABC transporter permease [Paenibacillaceae bacterium WGS1546]|uniref:ABC transporter permease n=1 Tax=Cohnella sp. WGS1546 TaxID=3366810 RepID=UPI00372D839B
MNADRRTQSLARQLSAIIYKDSRMLFREPQILSTTLIPFMYAVIYSAIRTDVDTSMLIVTSLTLVMCPLFIQAVLIVMDKETGELQALLRAGVPFERVLAGKSLLTCSVTLLSLFCSLLIMRIKSDEWLPLLWYTIPVLLTFMCLGTLLAFWYNSIQDVVLGRGFISFALIMLILSPILISFTTSPAIRLIYGFLPTGLVHSGMEKWRAGSDWGEQWTHWLICWAWTFGLFGITYRYFKRERSRY